MPATECRTRPSEAATSTMQMAIKIVEMRIMSRATPSGPNCPTRKNAEVLRHRLLCAPPSAMTLASMLIRRSSVLLTGWNRRSQRIGHGGAAAAQRLRVADGGIDRGLVLDFRVQLRPEQHDDGRHPHPHHQADRGPERTVGRVVIAEVR